MTSVHYKEENLLPCNDFIRDCQYVPTQPFDSDYVEQVVESSDKLFADMCGRLKLNPVSERQLVQEARLNTRSVTKDILIEWLETACYLLDTCCIPLLQKASEIETVQDTVKLQREKIDDQKSIIELQQKLLDVTENGLNNVQKVVQNTVQEELKSAQNTIQTEMKSYSSALTNTCSAALSQKKIRAAVKSATDSEDRSRNIIVYGVEESDSEVLPEKVSDILQEIGEKPAVTDCCRIGFKRVKTAVRPVKFTVRSPDVANQLLRKAKLLRSKEGFKSVYISPDRTVSERRAFKKLLEELKVKRDAEPDKFYVIRNNKIISTSEKCAPGVPGAT